MEVQDSLPFPECATPCPFGRRRSFIIDHLWCFSVKFRVDIDDGYLLSTLKGQKCKQKSQVSFGSDVVEQRSDGRATRKSTYESRHGTLNANQKSLCTTIYVLWPRWTPSPYSYQRHPHHLLYTYTILIHPLLPSLSRRYQQKWTG